MTATARKFATYQDIVDLPEHIVGEIIHGQLVTHHRPPPIHAHALTVATMMVFSQFHRNPDNRDKWWIFREPELRLGPNILVPELTGWRRERLPALPPAYFELSPDWVCEIILPDTARVDRADKMPIYAEYGVSFLWLIDPALHTLEAFVLRDGRWLLEHVYQEDDQVRAVPFDAIAFPLADLWS